LPHTACGFAIPFDREPAPPFYWHIALQLRIVSPYGHNTAFGGEVVTSMDLQIESIDPVQDPVDESLEAAALTGTWSALLTTARVAQATWAQRTVSARLVTIRRFAALVAHRAEQLAETVALPQRSRVETYTTELIPLAEAARYLVAHAPRLLRPRRETRGGGWWPQRGTIVETRREPWGVVLIVGPSPYPLLLPGVQLLQALAAGNAVLLKPGREATVCAQALRMLFVEAGGDAALVQILSEETDAVDGAVEAGADHVVMTASTLHGKTVLRQTAETLTPTTLALTGCDAVFVQADADVELAARAIGYGLTTNGGGSCLAPRRLFVHRSRHEDLLNALQRQAADWVAKPVAQEASERARTLLADAIKAGAKLVIGAIPDDDDWSPVIVAEVRPTADIARADWSAPVASIFPVDDAAQALEQSSQCPYALGASVFGEPRAAAVFARQVPAGCVVINDLIAPTNDPRVSIAPWNASGFGVTRGPEGLLQLTRLKVVVEQRSPRPPHLEAAEPSVDELQGWLNLTHGHSLSQRWRGLWQLARSFWDRSRQGQ